MSVFPVQVPVWCSAIAPSPPSAADLHIWRANLDQPNQVLEQLATNLALDEWERIERLKFPHHRQRAIASRGILRLILGGYLGRSPQTLQFEYSVRGKPRLQQPATEAPLSFNVTHSEHLALYAIATHELLGIDVEIRRPVPMLPQLIKRYFLPQEQQAIAAQPVLQQEHNFFYYWTAKEALTKATGNGITDLSKVELVMTATDIQVSYSQPATDDRWQVHWLEPQPGYAAAVAYSGSQPRSLQFWDWQPDLTCTNPI